MKTSSLTIEKGQLLKNFLNFFKEDSQIFMNVSIDLMKSNESCKTKKQNAQKGRKRVSHEREQQKQHQQKNGHQ